MTGWSGREPVRSRRSSSAGVGGGGGGGGGDSGGGGGSVTGAGEDEFLDWTDPVSNKSYKVNARTGNTVTLKRPASAGPLCPVGQKRVRVAEGQGGRPSQWVENLLKVIHGFHSIHPPCYLLLFLPAYSPFL